MAVPREITRVHRARERARPRPAGLAHPTSEPTPIPLRDPLQPSEFPADGRVVAAIGSAHEIADAARLEGVKLAAREMAHLLNNDLAVAVGVVDLLRERADLPPQLRALLEDAVDSLDSAAGHVAAFQRVVRVAVKETPAGTSLDLERSHLA